MSDPGPGSAPGGSDPGHGGREAGNAPVTFRPRRLRRTAVLFSTSLCAASALGWQLLPANLKETFNLAQKVTLLLILAAMVAGMVMLASSSVRADATGLWVRNGLRTHQIAWDDVHKILLRRGDPWALALIKPDDRPFEVDLDAEKRQLMGIQASDGRRAVEAVQELQRRQRAHRAGLR
ncbi:MAG: PH domain-containing protein [Actinomycetes bacterium]